MAKTLLNEAERYLLEKWGEARLLEESMEGVREKYKELFRKVVKTITDVHRDLKIHRCVVTPFGSYGILGFGKDSWPIDKYGSPAGFWMEGLRLEIITTDESDPLTANIWAPKSAELDFDAARRIITKEAEELFTTKDSNQGVREGTGEYLLYLPCPSKRQFVAALLEGDGQEFVELFVSQFDMMAKFIPVLDKVFRDCLVKE
jgi:hypothetical protein